MKKRTLAALLVLIAGPVLAQDFEPIGEIRASFRGEELVFQTQAVEMGGETMSSATVGVLGGSPGMPLVNVLQITGAVIVDGREAGTLHLTQNFDEHPQDGTSAVIWQSASVSYFPNRTSPPMWEMSPDQRSNVSYEVDSYYFDGETGTIAARFRGEVCRVDNLGDEADPADCHEISGSFETLLHREQG
ncbi:MAG: hypothetical protein GX970_02005 [Phyllobacteriaceae bacterium]|nr:hypothetical protein [Phyllobacteriaceae bacterium]